MMFNRPHCKMCKECPFLMLDNLVRGAMPPLFIVVHFCGNVRFCKVFHPFFSGLVCPEGRGVAMYTTQKKGQHFTGLFLFLCMKQYKHLPCALNKRQYVRCLMYPAHIIRHVIVTSGCYGAVAQLLLGYLNTSLTGVQDAPQVAQ